MTLWSNVNVKIVWGQAETDDYIVIVENQNVASDIEDDYNVTYASNDNIELQEEPVNGPVVLTADLSDKDVTILNNEEGVICIEEDVIISKEIIEELSIEDIVEPISNSWNLDIINVEGSNNQEKVKVAIIDSGVDLSDNLRIRERKNFRSEEFNAIFEDTCGHGTSIASILVGKGVNSEVNGINSDIELYSARVLDENKQAPLSYVISAIYWAIEQDVDIINMSFGTQKYSEALELAVNDAAKQGILVIASAGNNGNESVDYPAAFNSVLSVGAINANGDISEFSSRGENVDIFAPGESVTVQANFGEDLVLSGTSLATPHIVGVASLLWSIDISKSPEFIRTLIEKSAFVVNDEYKVADYEYALQIYDEVSAKMGLKAFREEKDNNDSLTETLDSKITNQESDIIEKKINAHVENTDIKDELLGEENSDESLSDESDCDNKTYADLPENFDMGNILIENNISEIDTYGEEIVNATWKNEVHKKSIENSIMKEGAVYQDRESSKLNGMTSHPEYHGYSWKSGESSVYGKGTSNYVANYRYLVKVASAYKNGKTYTAVEQSDIQGLTTDDYKALKNGFKNNIHGHMKSEGYTNSQKRAFVLGIAAHVATDAFAHSTFWRASSKSSWSRIKHPNADDVDYRPGRYKMALIIEKNVVNRYKGNRENIAICHDFHDGSGAFYDGVYGFRINKLVTFSKAAGVTNTTVLRHYKTIRN